MCLQFLFLGYVYKAEFKQKENPNFGTILYPFVEKVCATNSGLINVISLNFHFSLHYYVKGHKEQKETYLTLRVATFKKNISICLCFHCVVLFTMVEYGYQTLSMFCTC